MKNQSEQTIIYSEAKPKQRLSLIMLLTAIIFCILVFAIALAIFMIWLLSRIGIIGNIGGELNTLNALFLVFVVSLVIGSLLSFIFGKIVLKPVNNLIDKMNCLASGNYKTRLEPSGIISNDPSAVEISNSFNMLANELENTEMLREDFINNFSHEFKTPIVSIAGLAKLVNKGNLTSEQRAQYLTAIEEESMRLSNMATNVLNLTKVENQKILTRVSEFNLSEQIRSALLLFESQWTSKNIELQLDFNEHMIQANEELLKQVWINLISNAVKFVPRCGSVIIQINEREDCLSVTVCNTGSEIPFEKLEKIFNKFYQADESHAEEGNGIGLAIVKSIVRLHKGSISARCKNGMTEFEVLLPKHQ